MANFSYLWSNRAKFSLSSFQFYKVWAKRILLLPDCISKNWRRRRLIAKGADIALTAEIGETVIEGKYEYLKIGNFSFLGKAILAVHAQVSIGENVCINDGVQILTASHDVSDPLWTSIKKPIVIDDYVWIATNSIILPGVQIGRGAVIGAGAVVTHNVEPYAIMVGNPAKPITKKRIDDLKYNPCEFLATNRAWLIG